MRALSVTTTVVMLLAGSMLADQAPPPRQPTQASQSGPESTPTPDQQEIIIVLRQIAQAQFNRDVATFRRLTAEDFLHFDPDGSLTTKQDWLRILEDEPSRLATPPDPPNAPVKLTPGMIVRVVGNTAVVASSTPPAAAKGQAARVVTVLVKQNGAWQQLLVNRQTVEAAAAK
jgi:hypothetical protein